MLRDDDMNKKNELTFKSSESNELIPLLDSLSMGEIGGCLLNVGIFASESDSKNL